MKKGMYLKKDKKIKRVRQPNKNQKPPVFIESNVTSSEL